MSDEVLGKLKSAVEQAGAITGFALVTFHDDGTFQLTGGSYETDDEVNETIEDIACLLGYDEEPETLQ